MSHHDEVCPIAMRCTVMMTLPQVAEKYVHCKVCVLKVSMAGVMSLTYDERIVKDANGLE